MTANKQDMRIKFINRQNIIIAVLVIALFLSVFSSVKITYGYDLKGAKVTEDLVYVRTTAKSGINTNHVSISTGGTASSSKSSDWLMVSSGQEVIITDETTGSDNYIWYNISFTNSKGSYQGWIRSDFIQVLVSLDEDGEFEQYLTTQGFPDSYKAALRQLHALHPNWVFVADNIPLNFNDALTAESYVGKNLISKNSIASWKSTEVGAYNWNTNVWTTFDSGAWVSASRELVSYYLDPRNFLDDTSIFMFETLSYNEQLHTREGVVKLVAGTFMDEANIITEGDTTTTYPDILLDAARESGVSPFYLAASIIQEQGVNGDSALISGEYEGYEGYYNFFNVGASSGSSSATEVIKNGLKYAKNAGWNSRTASIMGGASFFVNGYINVGQDTLYYKKFDLIGPAYYNHQYMTNASAAKAEAVEMKKAYTEMMLRSAPMTFKIPVLLNMPEPKQEKPTSNANPNNYLKSLTVSGYSLYPTFTGATTYYDLHVDNEVKEITIAALAAASTSSVSGTGVMSLKTGTNTFEIVCTSESGVAKVYKLVVIRKNADGTEDETTSEKETTTEKQEETTTQVSTTPSYSSDFTVMKKGSRSYLSGLTPKMHVSTLIKHFELENAYIQCEYNGKILKSSARMRTGSFVKIYNSKTNKLVKKFYVIIYGDVNGDGKITSADSSVINKYLSGQVTLKDAFYYAADANRDGHRTSADVKRINNYIKGTKTIKQK